MNIFRLAKYFFSVLGLVSLAITQVFPIGPTQRGAQYIRFGRGQTEAVLHGTIKLSGSQMYKLRARSGQQLSVHLESLSRKTGDAYEVVFWIQGKDYLPGKDSLLLDGFDRGGAVDWSGKLPETGEYEIIISSPPVSDHLVRKKVLSYTLKVAIT